MALVLVSASLVSIYVSHDNSPSARIVRELCEVWMGDSFWQSLSGCDLLMNQRLCHCSETLLWYQIDMILITELKRGIQFCCFESIS